MERFPLRFRHALYSSPNLPSSSLMVSSSLFRPDMLNKERGCDRATAVDGEAQV